MGLRFPMKIIFDHTFISIYIHTHRQVQCTCRYTHTISRVLCNARSESAGEWDRQSFRITDCLVFNIIYIPIYLFTVSIIPDLHRHNRVKCDSRRFGFRYTPEIYNICVVVSNVVTRKSAGGYIIPTVFEHDSKHSSPFVEFFSKIVVWSILFNWCTIFASTSTRVLSLIQFYESSGD